MRITLLLLALAGLSAAQVTEAELDRETAAQLMKVRRVYIDLLSGGESAVRIRDMLMTSLQAARLFLITEDPSKADAILKGSAEDTAYEDKFQYSEGLNAHSQISLPTGNNNSGGRYSNRTAAGLSVGENESRRSEERKHEAIATVRLVSKDGDVIWSTTQESGGAKFMGAAADVADKVAKKLATDMGRAKSPVKP
jgi:hypothetical protein